MTIDTPLHFAPYLKSVIWGGEKISRFKGIVTSRHHIGESWEVSAIPGYESIIDRGPLTGLPLPELCARYGAALLGTNVTSRYGNEFPLLIKIIDTAQNLSVQVHPDDNLAAKRHKSRGKTEMWHIIDSSAEACIYLGLRKSITPDEYIRLVDKKEIMNVIASYKSRPGDTFFIPAGCIHAIGAGNLLVEVQESSDITYRIYDYDRLDADGNPRQLHSIEARDAIDYTVNCDTILQNNTPTTHREKAETLMQCRYFNVTRHNLDGGTISLDNNRESFMAVMSIGGKATLEWENGGNLIISQGDTFLLPASMPAVKASGHATLITVTCP